MQNGKRYGKSLPSPVDPDAFICFSMMIPDALQYRAALMGSLNFLGLWFAWDHENDGVVPDDNQIAAQLWVNAVATASFEVCMAFCEQVIDCILNDADTQAALVEALKDNETFNQYLDRRILKLSPTSIVSPIVEGSCDDSVLAGKIIAIVERLNTNNVDFLEIVEVGTNDEETLASVLEAIPLFDELPIGDAIDFAQKVLENFTENYNAAVTEGWKSDVEGDLWCLAKSKPDCVLTYQDLNDYFQNRAGSGLTIGALVGDVLQYLFSGDFSSDELVASGLYAIQLGFILTGQKFAGMTLPKLGAITRDADPSSAWEDWDPCEPDCDEYDFTVSDHGFTELIEGYAVYVAGEGWARGTGVNDGRCGLQAAIGNYVSVTFEYNMVADNPTSLAGLIEYPYPPYVLYGAYANTTGLTTFTIDQVSDLGGLAFDLGTTEGASHYHPLSEDWRLTKITVCRS